MGGAITFNGKTITELAHPDNSIYITTRSDINPAQLFGGDWTLLKSNFSIITGGNANVVGNGNELLFGTTNRPNYNGGIYASWANANQVRVVNLDDSKPSGNFVLSSTQVSMIANLATATDKINGLYIWERIS